MTDKVLFIPLIFFSAYILKHLRILRVEHSDVFVNYVIYFSLPALTLDLAREMEPTRESIGVVVTAWLSVIAGMTIAYLAGKGLRMSSMRLRTFMLLSAFGNTAFLGYPFAWAYFGEAGFIYAVLYDQLGSFIAVITLGLLVAVGRIDLREILTFPPLIALVLGILLREYNFPGFLESFLDVAGNSLIPAVLFALGLKFSITDIARSSFYPLFVVTLKMIALPVIISAVLTALSLTQIPFKVAVLQSAMPPMVMAGILAIKYGLDVPLAVSSITLGILVSFFTVPLIMSLLIQVP